MSTQPITATGIHPDQTIALQQTDPADLPKGHPVDAQAGKEGISPRAQLTQLLNYFEDSYPEIWRSLTTDEGAGVTGSELTELKDATERMWARVPDLITHCSLLVLGAGLDHAMPTSAFLKTGPDASAVTVAGLSGTLLRPSSPTGAVAVSLHGGPGWFGDAEAHDQLWLPLFAALAEKSGVTVVDLVYPLPGYGANASEEATRAAVAGAFREVQERAGELVGDASASATAPASADRVGLVTFGSGFGLARDVVEDAAFLLAMTPRITPALEQDAPSLGEVPTLVSVASEDTRATSAEDVAAFFDGCAPGHVFRSYLSEHIIGVPDVWRRRVSDDAEWMQRF
ncbi:MAG TPA: hypothetical protein H9870_06470 [Candidatus Corynebacterium avicola]|uniref:Alpha/beta hydrolase n=1 Tax=Candidatus Corynebacterium avicola TaxID=2838527 RepID=A0A9D1RRC6_9CORY|nr:hypothetical protein [Candidatus Corynebacterium avicola]